jgi:hypothetical protein
MSFTPSMPQPGMQVFASDAKPVGRVQEVRTDGLLVEATKIGHVLIPRALIAEVSEAERRVDLKATHREIADLGASASAL